MGGKDPAYVRADVDVDAAAKNLAVGATFNAGQSCCSVEVGASSFSSLFGSTNRVLSGSMFTKRSMRNLSQRWIKFSPYIYCRGKSAETRKLAAEVTKLKLGDPREAATSLGPVVSQRSAKWIRQQVADASQSWLLKVMIVNGCRLTRAVTSGAKALVPTEGFTEDQEGTNYVTPQGR